MKKTMLVLLVLGLAQNCLNAFMCAGSPTVEEQNAKRYFNEGENRIKAEINKVTNLINNEIKQTEDANTTLMQNIKSLQKEQAISESKRVFLLKKQNEIQSIINSINAEIDSK